MNKFEKNKISKEGEENGLAGIIVMEEEGGIIKALRKGDKTIRLNDELIYRTSGVELKGKVAELSDPQEKKRPIVLEFKDGKRGWFEFEDLFK